MCPEETQLQRAEFARSPSKPYDADRNVRHKVYRHKHYKLESGASLFRGIFFEPLHRLRLNVAILRCYRLRVGVLVAVVWVSCSERFASGLREVQSAGESDTPEILILSRKLG